MQNNTTSESPIEIIDRLYKDIKKDNWVNQLAQQQVLYGVVLVKQTLEKEGYNYTVLPANTNPEQLTFL